MMLTIRTNKQVDDDFLTLTSRSSWYTAVIWTSKWVDDLFFVFCGPCSALCAFSIWVRKRTPELLEWKRVVNAWWLCYVIMS